MSIYAKLKLSLYAARPLFIYAAHKGLLVAFVFNALMLCLNWIQSVVRPCSLSYTKRAVAGSLPHCRFSSILLFRSAAG